MPLPRRKQAGCSETRVSIRFTGIETADHTLIAEDNELRHERVFIVSWVDYCNKYGMGYALTDGTVGVHFNDSTTMLLAPSKQ